MGYDWKKAKDAFFMDCLCRLRRHDWKVEEKMIFLQIIMLLFFAAVVPIGMGAGAAAFVDKQQKNVCFMWIAGYLLLFAGFQILSVPFVLMQTTFTPLVGLFAVFGVLAATAGLFIWLAAKKKRPLLKAVPLKMERAEKALWTVFFAILAIQLFLAVFLAFADGDDAYYVAISTVTEASDTMYVVLPYTGGTTALDTRHALAPFPLLISFFSRVSGIHPAIISHVALPLLLLPLTYGIYGMLGSRLLKGKRKQLPAFLIFVELLIMWGNYSLYTAETFLITRTRQGKAALGNIVIPSLFLLLYLIGERLYENHKIEKSLWFCVFALVTAACLCSTLGGFLVAVLLGVFGLCTMVSYKKWKLILPIMLCLLPAAVYIGFYIILQ